MKNYAFSLLAAALFFCPIITNAQKATDTRSLAAFEKISTSGGFDKIILKEGAAESITLEVDGIDPAKIITRVKNNTLEIEMKEGNWSNYKAILTITYKNLREINNSGSSNFETVSAIKGDHFEINNSGSGNFKLALAVKKLDISLSGSGNMNLNGQADTQEIALSGSGNVNAKDLKGTDANVSISGSGNVSVNVSGKLRSAVAGSGNVTNQ